MQAEVAALRDLLQAEVGTDCQYDHGKDREDDLERRLGDARSLQFDFYVKPAIQRQVVNDIDECLLPVDFGREVGEHEQGNENDARDDEPAGIGREEVQQGVGEQNACEGEPAKGEQTTEDEKGGFPDVLLLDVPQGREVPGEKNEEDEDPECTIELPGPLPCAG